MKKKVKKISLFKKILSFVTSSKETFVISSEIIIGIALCFFSLVIFLRFTDEVMERDFQKFDQSITTVVYSMRSPTLTYLMMEVTSLGSGTQIVIISLVGIIFLIKQHKKESLLFSMALLIGILINTALKMIVQRPRPPLEGALIIEKMSSFPSGHATNAFIFFSLLAYFSYHFFKNKSLTVIISIFSVFCILVVGFSRIYLGVHHPTDVLAGYIVGLWWFITVLLIEHTFVLYKLFKKSE